MSSLRVFVLLPRALDAARWQERFARGEVPDVTPYGYHFAEEAGAKVSFSRPTATPGGLLGVADKVVKRLLGFDIRHAWNNRRALLGADYDVIWTHTEYEHLGIAALRALLRKGGPPVIAQSVWLIDVWPRLSGLKKSLYRYLLGRSAVATFHSPDNKAVADELGFQLPCEVVLFGISLDSFPLRPPTLKVDATRPVRVLALGNDRHRDWATLFEAIGGRPDFELRVGSSVWPRGFSADNVHVGVMTQDEVRAAYAWADCAVVPLKENLHASGITAILEAVALGVPVVATLTGGLPAYFAADAVSYVDPGDAQSLRDAIKASAKDPSGALRRAVCAQRQMADRDLTTRGFAMRHVRLSERLIANSGGNCGK